VFIDNKGDKVKMYRNLLKNSISTNFESHELSGGRLFIRIGTAEVTRRGMKEEEMYIIARLMDKAMQGIDVQKDVFKLNKRFPHIQYSFDQ
jgi:glycine/serine hydroxymethyltransferase